MTPAAGDALIRRRLSMIEAHAQGPWRSAYPMPAGQVPRFAVQQPGPSLGSFRTRTHTVYLADEGLLADPDVPDAIILAVAAHEYGHLVDPMTGPRAWPIRTARILSATIVVVLAVAVAAGLSGHTRSAAVLMTGAAAAVITLAVAQIMFRRHREYAADAVAADLAGIDATRAVLAAMPPHSPLATIVADHPCPTARLARLHAAGHG